MSRCRMKGRLGAMDWHEPGLRLNCRRGDTPMQVSHSQGVGRSRQSHGRRDKHGRTRVWARASIPRGIERGRVVQPGVGEGTGCCSELCSAVSRGASPHEPSSPLGFHPVKRRTRNRPLCGIAFVRFISPRNGQREGRTPQASKPSSQSSKKWWISAPICLKRRRRSSTQSECRVFRPRRTEPAALSNPTTNCRMSSFESGTAR